MESMDWASGETQPNCGGGAVDSQEQERDCVRRRESWIDKGAADQWVCVGVLGEGGRQRVRA